MTTKPVDFASPVVAAHAAFAASGSTNPFLAYASPFAARSEGDATDVADDAPEGSYTYAMVQSGAAVTAEECEVAAEAIEVVVRFGTSVLHVAHLSPPRAFTLGEEGCDVTVPADKLGAEKLSLVTVEAGQAMLAVPASATGKVTASGKTTKITTGAMALADGMRAELEVGGLTIEVAAVKAGKKVAGRMSVDAKSLPFQGLSLLFHGALLAATALFMPPMAMADEGGINDDQRYMIQQALDASAIREPEAPKEEAKADDGLPAEPSGGSGQRAGGAEGKMGSTASLNKDGRYGIKGDKSNTDLTLSRHAALEDAQTWGMVGLLASANLGSTGPTAPWGAEVAVGNDARSALGNMWGNSIDDAAGAGGLGLTGIGEGGGCRSGSCLGVGLGDVGTVGHGGGHGDGPGFGDRFGHSVGRLAPNHKPQGPRVLGRTEVVNGHIPADVIQRVVRQNFGRFRLCYENGLRGNPNLQGRVGVRFVIGRDGSVSQASNGGSDMPDAGVVSCVTRAFYGLSFPAPDAGIVTVSYPIVFTPGGA